MAINNSTFRKVSPPRSADEYLKEIDQLMRLNRGGGLLIGYDTDSNKPIYLPGKVADPTGLNDYAGRPTLNLPEIPQNNGNFQIDEEVASLENLLGLQDEFDAMPAPSTINLPEPYTPPEVDVNTPRLPSEEVLTKNAPIKTRSVPVQQYPSGSLGESLAKWASIPDSTINALTDPKSRELAQGMKRSATYFFEQENQAPETTPTPTPENDPQALDMAKNNIRDRMSSMVPQGEDVNLENLSFSEPTVNPIKSARMAMGNFVESIGDAIPGLGEHNVSEWIAGGPTKHTGQVRAAEDIDVSEPTQTEFQAGAGIQNLQKGVQPGALQQSSRPPISSINPAAPVIGNFAGIPASAVQGANKGMSQTISNPAQMNPMSNPTINPANPQSMSRTASFNQPQSQSYSSSSNNNQSRSSGSSYSPSNNTTKAGLNPAPNTSYKYIPPKQPIKIPLSNVGVGSNTPAPAPQAQSSSSNNIFSSVMNAIKNLFRRR